jgi:SAM-dependent methyltransferase
MAEISGKHLRSTFDEAAELYDRARPGYPPEPFNDLSDVADLRPGARILEFGPGTGQTTVPLAERKFQITAVELGPNLAAVARRTLTRFPNVAVTVAAFEDFPLPSEPFDAVVSATAFTGSIRRYEHKGGGRAVGRRRPREDCNAPYRWRRCPVLRRRPRLLSTLVTQECWQSLPMAADIPQDSAELEQSSLF